MPARRCVGRIKEDGSVEACCFNGRSVGQPANALTEDSRCVWCSPAEMHRRIGNGRLEKLLVYSLLNFNEDIRAVALGRLPPEALHIQEAVQEQLAGDAADDEEAEEAVPAVLAAGSSADAPTAEEDDDGEDTDVDSNVVEDAEDVPLTIAEADFADLQDANRAEEHSEAESQTDGLHGAAAEGEASGVEASSSQDDDAGVLGEVVAPVEEEILPGDLEDDYAWLFGGFASDDEQERVATAVAEAELMQEADDVGVAVAVAAAAEDEEAGTADPAPKRRRLRHKQPPTGAWLKRDALPAAVVERRPQKTRGRHSELCPGDGRSPCTFSTSSEGSAATEARRIVPSAATSNLLLYWRAQVTKTLSALRNISEKQFELALSNLASRRGKDLAEDFRSRVLRATKRAEQKREPKLSTQEVWSACLKSRMPSVHQGKRQKKAYKKQVQRERAAARRKVFFPDEIRRHVTKETEDDEVGRMPLPPADIAINDTSLPAASRTERAARAEEWCKHGSWQICQTCHGLCPRPFRPVDLKHSSQPLVKACGLCKKKDAPPQPGDVPGPLQQLPKQVIEALRPLDIDTGVYERVPQGYRVHSSMIRFAWSTEDVETKISKLAKNRHKKLAKKAFHHLTEDIIDKSSYVDFINKHRDFLEQFPEADERKRKRPLRFIEEQGIECALWPHLYWHTNLCETVVRATDERRQQARHTGLSDSSASEASDADDEDGDIELKKGRHSIRRSFMKKVLGPILGYSQEYELLHFVYDLSLWSSLGGCKNATAGRIPLALALKAATFSPEYWRVRHLALIDMQRQCGLPRLFRTRAPIETTFPYHAWVLDEMEKSGHSRRHLAGPETLHMAHVLTEMDRGLFTGTNTKNFSRADRCWADHILGASDGSGRNTVINFCSRLEFQDGKRKRGTQKYHGSGRVHSHSVDFLENIDAIELHKKIAASIPDVETDPMLHGIVVDSQKDWSRSGVPIREEPSTWDAESNMALLHHSEEDYEAHIRPYFPETMEVTKCHEDVQQGEGTSALLRYVATYQQRFSSSFAKEWLNDEASDYSIARRVLFDHHPLEPEMWLTLFAQKFPQCVMGGTLMDIRAPIPGADVKPEFVERYELCKWRRGSMTLLEFLRKSNADGGIIQWLKRKHRQSGEDCTVEEFANNYITRGEKVVAVFYVSRLRDEFYGQWMATHIPFEKLEDLLVDDIVAKVPDRMKHFACAMSLGADYWDNEEQVKEDMQLECIGNDHIETVLNFIKAQRHLLGQYLDGELGLDDELDVDLQEDQEEMRKPAEDRVTLDPQQRHLKHYIDKAVKTAVEAREAIDDDTYEAIVDAASYKGKIVVVLGPPGTGKTTVVHKCVKKWHQEGARILFALPTGQLASEIRRVHPEINVDTCHGAFLFHKDLTEALPILTQYDLVIVDELSMLTAEHYDRIYAMWQTAEKLPCIVLMGDFYQLPGPQKPPSRICDSAAYAFAKKIHFDTVHRCKDPVLAKKLKALRTSVPSMKLLKKIVKKHRAWTSTAPTEFDVLQVLREHENTSMLTCTRNGARQLNDLAITVLFKHRHKKLLASLPGDWQDDPGNFGDNGEVPKGVEVQPVYIDIFEGMRIVLTLNLNKRQDFVNGMTATVEAYDEDSGCLQVFTKTGKRLAVPCVREKVESHDIDYFPIRAGYASTIQKVQGQTLEHVTIWLDRAGCKAAGYVALARVRRDADYLIAGRVTPHHFVPAM